MPNTHLRCRDIISIYTYNRCSTLNISSLLLGPSRKWNYRLSTAKGMGIVGQQMNAKFALAVGDNFYSSGIRTDVHDQRFKSTFEVRQ